MREVLWAFYPYNRKYSPAELTIWILSSDLEPDRCLWDWCLSGPCLVKSFMELQVLVESHLRGAESCNACNPREKSSVWAILISTWIVLRFGGHVTCSVFIHSRRTGWFQHAWVFRSTGNPSGSVFCSESVQLHPLVCEVWIRSFIGSSPQHKQN